MSPKLPPLPHEDRTRATISGEWSQSGPSHRPPEPCRSSPVRNWVSNVLYRGEIHYSLKEMQPSYHPIPPYSFCPNSPPHFSTTPVPLASCCAFIIHVHLLARDVPLDSQTVRKGYPAEVHANNGSTLAALVTVTLSGSKITGTRFASVHPYLVFTTQDAWRAAA